MYTVTPVTVGAVVVFYAALFVIIRIHKKKIERVETKTFFMIAFMWAVSTFVANYLLFLIGLMSFLPWINNFLHTFVWIGVCLTFLYLGIREDESMPVQIVAFATFSLIVKYAENLLFGTWDHGHFFYVFKGKTAYILGWSLADGLYPVLTLYGLRILRKFIPGLIAL
ncbi:MAG: hypothetical protein ACE5G1_07730 [bacterium]